jgi:hypothetical protein
VSVAAVTLDDHLATDGELRTAMWVDVEGASGSVLRGARVTLTHTDVVIVEVEERQVWEGAHWLRPTVVEYLVERGLVPVARDLQSRFQHNIVFVRDDLVTRPDIAHRLDRWGDELLALTSTRPPS